MRGSTEEVRIEIAVAPGAKREELTWDEAAGLKVRVTAPAVDGKANRAMIALLARRLGVPASDVSIVHGANGRKKLIAVAGLTRSELSARLRQQPTARR